MYSVPDHPHLEETSVQPPRKEGMDWPTALVLSTLFICVTAILLAVIS